LIAYTVFIRIFRITLSSLYRIDQLVQLKREEHLANDDAVKWHRRPMWKEFFRCVAS